MGGIGRLEPAMERFASGVWLDRRLMRVISGLTIAMTLAALAYLYAGSTGTLDGWGRPLGTDFSNVWTAGLMALEGRASAVYDLLAHYRVQQAAHASEAVPFYGWLYPPPFLLLAAGLATLPYLAALVLFQVATLAPALLVIGRILPDRDTVLVALGCPAVLVCLTHGHNGFLTAALFGAGLLALERRPILAGICFGLLAYKPHFGLILPLALLAGGYGRAIASAGVTVAVLVAGSAAVFGPEIWTAFLGSLGQTRTIMLEAGGPGWHTMQSAFSAVRAWGGSIALAYAAQGIVTLAVMAGTFRLWHGRAPFELRAAALLVGALLATPYVMDYDMVLLGPAIAFLVRYGMRNGFAPWEKTVLALCWFAPIAARQLALTALVPAGFMMLALLFGLVLRRAGQDAPARRGGSVSQAA
ncbi:glycosyltransferase family 87 protein [uncultured Enterovirga sp.]|uniref:glycosyltransferase family 87 protein n=1 Tax=uncultured Enterovirga sp. TaxID=2026352 RepID=UPI0035CB338C